MGDLGGRLGALVARSALTGIDQHLQQLVATKTQAVERYAKSQAEIGLRLARQIQDRQSAGQPIDDEEMQALERELARVAEEAAPHYQELERQVEEMNRQLEPTRERMRGVGDEIRREVEAWRGRHADLLRQLEAAGYDVPSYSDEDAGAKDE
jgi:flagellar motility protein MotE (MotC chaperone)